MSSQKIYYIEGNIASGKTTFLDLVTNYLPNCQVIYEPLEVWQNLKDSNNKNILDHFYQDMKKYGYAFQSFAFLSRVNSLKDIDKNSEYVFIERSIYSDKNIFANNCYNKGLMTEIEWILYNEWFKWMDKYLKLPNSTHIYMKCAPEISYQRLLSRNRDEEKGVELDYLVDIHNCHERWIGNTKYIINAEQSFKDNKQVMKQMVNEIINF